MWTGACAGRPPLCASGALLGGVVAAGPSPLLGKYRCPSAGPTHPAAPSPPQARDPPVRARPRAGSLRTEAVCPRCGSQGCLPQSQLSSEPASLPWSEEPGKPRVRRRPEELCARLCAHSSARTALCAHLCKHRVCPPGVRGPRGEDEGLGLQGPGVRQRGWGLEAAWTWARPGAGLEGGGVGPSAACLSCRPQGASACDPLPLVPLEPPGCRLTFTGPSAWGHCPLGCHHRGLPGHCPLGQEASNGARGWPPLCPLAGGAQSLVTAAPTTAPRQRLLLQTRAQAGGVDPEAWSLVLWATRPGSCPWGWGWGARSTFRDGGGHPRGSDTLSVFSRGCSWRGRLAPKAPR